MALDTSPSSPSDFAVEVRVDMEPQVPINRRNNITDIPISDEEETDGLARVSPLTPNSERHQLRTPSSGCLSSPNCGRNILAFLFLFYNMTLNLFVLAVVHERVPTYIQSPLPDISFDILPKRNKALDIAEYIIVLQMALLIITMLTHQFRATIFRRLCLVMGILYLFRAFCMISTVLPRANQEYYCSPQLFNSSDANSHKISAVEYTGVIFQRVMHMLTGFGLSIYGKHSYCGDYIYSGHTVSLVVSYLFIREYLIPARCRTWAWKLLNVFLLLCSFTAILAILISRGHYLIDILLAYYVTTRVFWIYHSMVYNNSLRMNPQSNYLNRVWWYFLFRYFEGLPDVHKGGSTSAPQSPSSSKRVSSSNRESCNHCDNGNNHFLPRAFEWPFPWPQWLRRRTTRYRQRLLTTPPA